MVKSRDKPLSEPSKLTYDERAEFACEVCGNVPDEYGIIEHGRGCYTQCEDGGGLSIVELPMIRQR